jgi:hypothetical protein
MKMPVGMERNLGADAQHAKDENQVLDRFHFSIPAFKGRTWRGSASQSIPATMRLLRDHQEMPYRAAIRRALASSLSWLVAWIFFAGREATDLGAAGAGATGAEAAGVEAPGVEDAGAGATGAEASGFTSSGLTASILSDFGSSLEARIRPLGWLA